MQLQFENPSLFLLLIPLAGYIGIIAFQAWRHRSSFSLRRSATSVIGLLCCILGLCRPQIGHQTTDVSRNSGSLVLAVDISRSMMAEDTKPSRLKFSVVFAKRILAQLAGAKVALYPFSEDGFIQIPFTNDLISIFDLLSTLDPSMSSNEGSDLGYSLESLYENISEAERKAKRRNVSWTTPQVLLLSDGESHETLNSEVLARFRAKGIPIFTVGVGTSQGAALRIPSLSSARNVMQFDGKNITTKMDSENLKLISSETGGEYFAGSFSAVGPVVSQLKRTMQYGKLNLSFVADAELFPYLFSATLLLLLVELGAGGWQFAIRIIPFALLLAHPPLYADEAEREMDDELRAIKTFNEGVQLFEKNDLEAAVNRFQESLFIATDPKVKKMAMYNLGNLMLRLKDPDQALQHYQEAMDFQTAEEDFELETNSKISENMVLALQIKEQSQSQKQGQGDQKSESDQPSDPKGPQQFEGETFNQAQKQRIFDLIANEEQEILKRLRRQNKGKPQNPSSKPW